MELTSEDFEPGGNIPKKHSCEGPDASPAFRWSGAPPGTRTLALICEDPDAPFKTFTHWLVWDIPVTRESLPSGLAKDTTLPDGIKQGRNDFGRYGYGGPCPPNGSEHHYHFVLYALDTTLNLPGGSTKGEVKRAMERHVLATCEIVGTYEKVGLRRFVKTLLGRH